MKSQFTAGRIPAAAAGVQARGAQAAASRSSRVVLSCAALALGGLLVAGNARAESVTRVYQSRMPDGSVVFGDKPAQGAVQHEGRDYRLPDAPPAATLEAERRNWSEQNRAFEQRYTDRLAIEAAKRQQAQQDALLKALVGGLSVALSPSDTLVYGGVPVWGPGARPVPPMVGQGSAYRSSPGAVNGRGAPFLSSGFQAHGPN